MKRNQIRFAAWALAGLTALSMTACGGTAADGQGKNAGKKENQKQEVKEWVWVPEFIELGENASYYEIRYAGDSLYYQTGCYNEESGNYEYGIARYSLTEATTETTVVPMEESKEENGVYSRQNMNAFTPLADGGMAVILSNYRSSADSYESWATLVKYDADWNQVFSCDMKELMADDEDNSYIRTVLEDSEGRLYLIGQTRLWLFDAQGVSHGTIQTDDWIDSAGVGRDGKVYICYYSYQGGASGGYVLAEADFDSAKLGNAHANFVAGSTERVYAGTEGDFIVQDSTSVYEYHLESQTLEKLFDWLDSDINGSYVNMVGEMPDGRILAAYEDWSTDEGGVVLLTKTPGSEVAQKEQLVIGTMSSSSELQAAAVKFNRSSDKYHLSIREYVDYNNYTETSWSDALTNVNNDLISGNGPDIMCLDNLNYSRLASKGVFEDLTPYLEKSTTLAREDYLESILDAYTIGGRLIAIPGTFEMATIAGHASQLGTEPGWTLTELVAYANAHPEAEVFDSMMQEYAMQLCMMYNENSFINWEEGTCSFDTEEFKALLEFVASFPADYEWEEGRDSEPTRIQKGEVLLSYVNLYDFDELQLYEEMFGGDMVCIGFPSADGNSGCAFSAGSCFAITNSTGDSEGAWEFIESYLNEQAKNGTSWGFPTNKKALAEMAEEAVRVDYLLDENGQQILNEDGEPIVLGGGSGVGYEDGWEYTYRKPTQEEVDTVLALMETAKPASYGSEDILKIINEEAGVFYSGQKTVDDTVKVIQSRIQMYVSENS